MTKSFAEIRIVCRMPMVDHECEFFAESPIIFEGGWVKFRYHDDEMKILAREVIRIEAIAI